MPSPDRPIGPAHAGPFVPRVTASWLLDEPQRRWRTVDGALVFVDISGFTAMSERLAVLGREGAERVTEIIDGAFSSLLGRAYGLGGSLLKFGGDALLLLFEGDAAGVRAAAAAYDMREALHRLGAIKTPAGTVQLDMSVGVHVGAVDLFLVGRSHRELLVVGRGASTVVRTEGDAGAGRILLSSEAASELPADVVGAAHGSGHLLVARPTGVGETPAVVPEPSQVYWRALSTALRRHLVDDGRDRAEHRRAVVGFVHFEDTDQMLAEIGHERMADALDELVSTLQAAVDRRQLCLLASDVDVDGGKLIVTAGVPEVHEDDADRMLLAMREVVEARTAVPVRIGVHGGPLFAGEVGPPFRRTFTVMGDVVNTAARVMSRAGSHEVLATDELLASTVLAYELESVPPFEVKGKAEPLVASVVGPAQIAEASIDDHRPPVTFVGRADEVADLVQRFDRARAGQGSAVELLGAPGVGKTEVIRALVDVRSSARVVVLRCQDTTSDMAYRPVRSAMLSAFDIPLNAPKEVTRRELDRSVGALLGDQLPVIEVALGLRSPDGEIDPKAFRIDLAAAIDQLLRSSFPDGLLLVVENAQWIDDGTADLVRALVDRSHDRPYLVVVTARTEHATLGGTAVQIGPLDEFHATELARLESNHRLLPSVANAIARRSGGNPLFVHELVDAVLSAGGEVADADALPGSLESLLVERIDRLPPSDRALIRQLAVLGNESLLGEVAAFVDIDRRQLELTVARLSEFVVVDTGRETLRFRQTLLVDAAYESLTFRRRRELHRRAADLLESRTGDPNSRAEDLSRHCSIAAEHRRAWTYSLVAGHRSADQAAFAQAVVFFRRALHAARRLSVAVEDRAEIYRLLGHSCMVTGQHDAADDALRNAARLARDEVEIARIAINRGQLARERSELVSSIRHFRRGRRLMETGLVAADGHERAGLLARAFLGEAAVRLMQSRRSEARALALEGLRFADSVGDEIVVANACTWLVQMALPGDDGSAITYGRRAAEIFGRHGRRRHLAHVDNALGVQLFNRGMWEEAVTHAERAITALDQLGLPSEAAVGRLNLAFRLEQQQRHQRAAELFEEAERVFVVLEHPLAAYAGGMRATADAARGPIEGVFDRYRAATARLDEAGRSSMADDVHVAWAEVMVEREEAELAVRALEAVKDQQNAELIVRRPRLEARLALLAGGVDRAILLAEEAVMVADDAGDDYQLARALDLRADVAERSGGPTSGSSDRQRAKDLLARFGVVHSN